MNILSLDFFKLLRKRSSKVKVILEAQEKLKKDARAAAEITAYTLVSMKHKQSSDMLTTVHMASKHLDQARIGQKSGKARWLQDKTEQHYRPRELRIDPQLEFIYDELGLSKELEKTSFI